MRHLLVASFLVVLAACQAGGDRPPTSADTAAVSSPDAGSETAAGAADAVLALDPEGLRLIDPASGAARPLSFGAAEAEVVAVLAGLEGEPDDRGTNSECGAGPLSYAGWEEGLTLYFSDGQFAGWAVDGRAPGAARFTTPAGIGTGSTRADLDAAYDVQIEEGSIGTVFIAGDLYGLLDGPGPDAAITALWSGTSCNFG